MASGADVHRSLSLPSEASALVPVYQDILAELLAKGYADEDIFSIHLALEEAFLNAVRHGNADDPSKHVLFDYIISSEKADFFITDEGEGFKPADIPDPRSGENLFKAGGRGLFLIRHYMDVAEYSEKGNCLHIIKFRTQDAKLP